MCSGGVVVSVNNLGLREFIGMLMMVAGIDQDGR